MRRRCLLLWTWSLLLASDCVRAEVDARDAMTRNFFATKVAALNARLTMMLVNENGEKRIRQTALLSKLQANGIDSTLLITFLAPSDVKGTRFLQVEHSMADDDIWVFLPALQKVRRLVANNKKDNFFGSDFSYGDILLPPVEAYGHRRLADEDVQGRPCYVIESIPRTEDVKLNSGYSKKISWLSKESFLEARVDYYDLSGVLFKTQTTGRHLLVDAAQKRWLILHREMKDLRTSHQTIIDIDNVKTGISIADSALSLRALERE